MVVIDRSHGSRAAHASGARWIRRAALPLGIYMCSWSPFALGQSGATPASPAAHGGVTLPRTEWPTNGGDLYNRRYSPLEQINRGNVSSLRGVWQTRLNGSGVGPKYSAEAQPIVVDGIIYLVTGANDVFALDVDTGKTLWSHQANLDPAINTVCCSWTSRGVGLGEGKVYVGQLDGKLVALDSKTGHVEWSTQAERWQEGFSITSAPLYYNGLVVTGFAGGEFGMRGRVKAFDAADGSLVWTFFTIPGPGEPGSDTWPADGDAWKRGGAPVWQTPAVDPDLGLLYFATGNPGPDYNGVSRRGDNLYSVSIVAVDVHTGAYRWHFQQVHHDLWDYDAANPVVLFDLTTPGGARKRALAQAGKTGWVYILDRETGEPVVGIEERPVPQEPRQATAATQPHPIGDAFVPQSIDAAPPGTELVNDGRVFTPFWTERPVFVKPASGANWPPSAFDPATERLYVCAGDRAAVFQALAITEAPPEPGAFFAAGVFANASLPRLGTFTAMSMRTNRIVWQQQWPEPCYSGVTATRGGLVFVGQKDGRLLALDSDNGAKLWEFQTGAGMHAPVATFERRGKQYVAAYAGGNGFARSSSGDYVWLFALDGTLGPAKPESSLSPDPSP